MYENNVWKKDPNKWKRSVVMIFSRKDCDITIVFFFETRLYYSQKKNYVLLYGYCVKCIIITFYLRPLKWKKRGWFNMFRKLVRWRFDITINIIMCDIIFFEREKYRTLYERHIMQMFWWIFCIVLIWE